MKTRALALILSLSGAVALDYFATAPDGSVVPQSLSSTVRQISAGAPLSTTTILSERICEPYLVYPVASSGQTSVEELDVSRLIFGTDLGHVGPLALRDDPAFEWLHVLDSRLAGPGEVGQHAGCVSP